MTLVSNSGRRRTTTSFFRHVPLVPAPLGVSFLLLLLHIILSGRNVECQSLGYYPWSPAPEAPLRFSVQLGGNVAEPPLPTPLRRPHHHHPLQLLSQQSTSPPGNGLAAAVSCGGPVVVRAGAPVYIVSPNSPEAYPPNVQCRWEAQAPFGHSIAFVIEQMFLPPSDIFDCQGDRIEIIDIHHTQRYCLFQYGGVYLSVGSSVSVRFISDRVREEFPARFRIRLEASASWCADRELTAMEGEISSPSYPQPYPANVICGWRIKGPSGSRIRLQCSTSFWLEPSADCSNDFLAVGTAGEENMKSSPRFCGFRGPGILNSEGHVMTLLFHSNSQFVFSGFRCHYKILTSLASTFGFPVPLNSITTSMGLPQNPATVGGGLPFSTSSTTYPSIFLSSFSQLAAAPPPLAPAALSASAPVSQACDCGRANKKSVREARIVGGTQTGVNAYPWVVAVFKRDGRQYCAGSLIDQQHILTASHCVARLNPSDIYVSLGDHDLDITEETRSTMAKVKRILVHPGYRSTPVETDDIALLQLAQPVTPSAAVRPVCLPAPDMIGASIGSASAGGQAPTVVGWGKLSEAGLSTSVLREATLPIQSNAECQRAYGYSVVTENMICAGQLDGSKDACQGDSGGPMMIYRDSRWYMVGIVSYGFGCARPEFPGVYTRIDRYIDWIRTNVRSMESGATVTAARCDDSASVGLAAAAGLAPAVQEHHVHRIRNPSAGMDVLNNRFGWRWNRGPVYSGRLSFNASERTWLHQASRK